MREKGTKKRPETYQVLADQLKPVVMTQMVKYVGDAVGDSEFHQTMGKTCAMLGAELLATARFANRCLGVNIPDEKLDAGVVELIRICEDRLKREHPNAYSFEK
jgi:hypothetical protein